MNAPVRIETLPRFASALKAIESLKPGEPLYLVYPDKFAAAARTFLTGFPGDVLYAVKANPHPIAIQHLWGAGIRHFDTASLGEIEIVKNLFPAAICHFMAPVRLPGHAKAAFEKYGVTDYVVDSPSELDKLLTETGNPKKLRIFVRLVAQLGGALLEMSSKYGCSPEEAAIFLCSGDRDRPAHRHPVGSRDSGARYWRRFSHQLCGTGSAALPLVFRHGQGSAGDAGSAGPAGAVRARPGADGAGSFAGDASRDAPR
jgi:diaminopimelate decarboxylase